MERTGLGTRDILLLFCMFALCKDERKLHYSRSNILAFISIEYFTSDNVPDGIKNTTHNTFSNFREKLANEIKISSFFDSTDSFKFEMSYNLFFAWVL
jgi:hypothetical protein